MAHFVWALQYRCVYHNVYNATTCQELYAILPTCVEKIELAFSNPTVENRVDAISFCNKITDGDTHGTVQEDIRLKVSTLLSPGTRRLTYGGHKVHSRRQ